MNKYYYKKSAPFNTKKIGRLLGAALAFGGFCVMMYVFLPLIIWQFTLGPVFASQGISFPIPKTTMVGPLTIKSLLASSVSTVNTNYDDANSWFPTMQAQSGHYSVSSYTLSIPSIGVNNATVSTTDSDLGKHLVHLQGSVLPPDKGIAIVFGHSTLPYLFDPSNYHTILANAYKIKVGDVLLATVNNITYTYKVYELQVVNPDDTSVLIQHTDDSYFELITCTPPGTVWQRLVIHARLEKI